MLDKVRGSLWGAVVGDALGLPFEGTPRRDLPQLAHAVQRRAQRASSWGYSDDSEMMLVLAASLAEHKYFDTQRFLTTLAHEHDVARGYGKGTRRLLEAHLRGTPIKELPTVVWADGSKATGGTVRLPPLVCWYAQLPHKAFSSLVHEATFCTHAHPDALAASQLFCHSLRWLLTQDPSLPQPGQRLINHLKAEVVAASNAHLITKLGGWLDRDFNSLALVDDFGHGLLALEAVPVAIACVLSNANDFEAAVTNAVSLGGDTDTIAALVGALSGALLGVDAVPALWRQNLKHERKLRTFDLFIQAMQDAHV